MQDFNIPKSFRTDQPGYGAHYHAQELTNNNVTLKQLGMTSSITLRIAALNINNYDVDDSKTFKPICLVTSVLSCPLQCYCVVSSLCPVGCA